MGCQVLVNHWQLPIASLWFGSVLWTRKLNISSLPGWKGSVAARNCRLGAGFGNIHSPLVAVGPPENGDMDDTKQVTLLSSLCVLYSSLFVEIGPFWWKIGLQWMIFYRKAQLISTSDIIHSSIFPTKARLRPAIEEVKVSASAGRTHGS